MRAPVPRLIEIEEVEKAYGAPEPLRVRRFAAAARDRFVITGLDLAMAETFVHLITGASVPDTGTLRVGGRDTRDIATDTEWLASLDRFGIVTRRAVLIDALPIAANLALPLTLSIDPMSGDTRTAVEALARVVRLPLARLTDHASTLTPAERVRVHLARALATGPDMLLLEQPTVGIDSPSEREDLGRTLRDAAESRNFGWLAFTDDETFIRGSASRRLRLVRATGEMAGEHWWRKLIG